MANIKWCYQDHWSMDSPRGKITPYSSREYADSFVKQIGALGFKGFHTFANQLNSRAEMFGSVKQYLEFLNERGIEKIVGAFHDYAYATKYRATHDRATHDAIFRDYEEIMGTCDKGWNLENLIIMPSSTYWQVEPITDEKLHAIADLFNRIGKMTLEHGVKASFHHEFWCGVRTQDAIEKFYNWTDPKYVYYFCDTAQHQIAGVDPVQLYMKLHDRCIGFHFKDTHVVDTTEEYRTPPDAEGQALTHPRWFWEPGSPGGLVDFPAIMKAMKEYGYKGWVGVELDGTQNYAESTCTAKWYIDNVLRKIYE
jgi:inosose dehydratase